MAVLPIARKNNNLQIGPSAATRACGRSFLKMNSDQFEGKWKQLKGTVKQKWGKLTDDDLLALTGKKDEFIGKLQERYGYSKEQALREADEWAAAAHDPAIGVPAGKY